MKHTVARFLLLLTAAAVGSACTEPSAEERALAKVWVVHVDRPAADEPFFVGTSQWLTATAFDSAGVAMKDAPLTFQWESTHPEQIAVDPDGRVTAKQLGGAWIYARLPNGIYGNLYLAVQDEAKILTTNPDSARMLPGQRKTLALQYLSDPGLLSVHGWSSSNPAVATVDDSGMVTAVAPGSATISTRYVNTTFRSEVYVAAVATPLRFASLTTDGYVTCGLAVDGQAYCWGSPSDGMLGSTDRTDRCVDYNFIAWPGGSPPPHGSYTRRVAPCAMEPVRVETPLRFASLEANAGAVCGTTGTGEAHCWGATGGLTGGASGPTVVPVSTQLRFTGFHFPCGVTVTGDAWCFGDPTLRGAPAVASTTPTQVTGAGIWRAVAATSSTHRCGVTTDDVVQCWGGNALGQLGTGTTIASSVPVAVQSTERFSTVAVSSSESCALSLSGALYCWGNNVTRPTAVATSLRFTAIAITSLKTCALGTDGARYCRTAAGAMADETPGLRFRALARGSVQQCGIGQDGLAYCWLANNYGQLGTGDNVYRYTPALVAGQ